MKNTLKKIGLWMWNHKKMLMLLSLVVVAVFHPHLVNAEDTAATADAADASSAGGNDSPDLQALAELANVFVKFFNTLLWPLLLIIGDLMDVDMITGPGMEERLLAIWVEMRNLVNIAIALVLVVVAFYNVLGLGGGEGELAIKTALPKIVLGLILVNFTYVGGKVILDVANVGTTIAFSLPQIMEQSDTSQFRVDSQLDSFEKEICYPAPTIKDNGTPDDDTDDTSVQGYYTKKNAPIQTQLFCELVETPATTEGGTSTYEYKGMRESLKSVYFSDLNKNNIAIVMAVNMGSLGSLELFKAGAVKTYKDLTVNTIFAVVMYMVFAVSYVVLAIVLLVRLVVLWLALALSPVAVLVYVVPQIKEWLGGGGDFEQKVIKHLVAPIIIGLTLSMGLLLMEGWSVIGQDSFSAYSDTKVTEVISTQFLVSGIDDLPKLILAIASIVVVWMGVFAAASDTYAAGITDKIKDFGGTIKEALTNAPMLMPMLPISVNGEDQEKMSPMALKALAEGALRQVSDGGMLQNQLNKISEKNPDNAFVNFAMGNHGADNRSSAMSETEIQRMMAEISDGKIDQSQAIDLASNIASRIAASKIMSTEDKTAMSKEFIQLRQDLENGKEVPRERFREIFNKYEKKTDKDGNAYDADAFGIKPGNLAEIKGLKLEKDTNQEPAKKKEEPGATTEANAKTPPAATTPPAAPAEPAAPSTAPETPPAAPPVATPPPATPAEPAAPSTAPETPKTP